MGCCFFGSGAREQSLLPPSDVYGTVACRRLSLSDAPSSVPAYSKSGAALRGASGATSVSARAASCAARSGSAWTAASVSDAATTAESYVSNPLRRLSLPMNGAEPRPMDELRRSSMVASGASSASGASMLLQPLPRRVS